VPVYDFEMRSILCALAPLILISAASAQINGQKQATDQQQYQTGYCPQTHQLEAAPQAKYWFEGAIGKRSVPVNPPKCGKPKKRLTKKNGSE
jgi:hypothetical protein